LKFNLLQWKLKTKTRYTLIPLPDINPVVSEYMTEICTSLFFGQDQGNTSTETTRDLVDGVAQVPSELGFEQPRNLIYVPLSVEYTGELVNSGNDISFHND
jgi:hypothetical protein